MYFYLRALHTKFVHKNRVKRLADTISKLIPANSHILDVGSGDGLLGHCIMKKSQDIICSGIDILEREHSYIKTIIYDGKRIPFDDNQFDVVMFIDVLHHSENPLSLLSEGTRVSKKYIIIKDHISNCYFSKVLLKIMDWIGNRGYNVSLKYNYLSYAEWKEIFSVLNLKCCLWDDRFLVRDNVLSKHLESGLHFIAKLEKTITTNNFSLSG